MAGIAPMLPLTLDEQDGAYKNIKNFKDLVKQNIKTLLLTVPGERIIDPLYGIGLYSYLFENNSPAVQAEINDRILQQIRKYMPYLEIRDINIRSLDDREISIKGNSISISIKYGIKPLGVEDILDLNLVNNLV